MRLCIPTETNEGRNAQAYGHFGSAPYFTIVDTKNDCVEVINNANQHHAHGMCQPMNALAGKSIDAVATSGMGFRAVQKLNQSGIRAYQAIQGTVEDIVRQFVEGSLREITLENACGQHGCH